MKAAEISHFYPRLFDAMLALAQDNGMLNRTEPWEPDIPLFVQLPHSVDKVSLVRLEQQAASLSPEELEEIAVGDYDVSLELVRQREVELLAEFLDACFEGDLAHQFRGTKPA